MKTNFCKLLLGAGLVLSGLAARAQGLQGVVVETYHVTNQADADYYNGIGDGSYLLEAGMTTYRVYIDLAPNYRINTVFGSASNTMQINSTSRFFNDDAYGSHLPPQTARLDDGAAFDSWLTIGRAARSLGSGTSCGGNLEQLGVPKASDTNGNLTMCNLWSGFGPADNDGHVPGTSIDPSVVGISSFAAFVDDATTAFSTTGSLGHLPPQNGPEVAGANRVLIGQFTTAGTLTFHINVSVSLPGGPVEFYTHTNVENGSTVNGALNYPAVLPPDCNGVPGGPAVPGSPCNDNNACTINDVYTGVAPNCGCAGTIQDTDGDGTCDANDGCPADPNKIAAGACGCGVADVPATYYADTDGDGFGAGTAIAGFTCTVPPGTVTNNTDQCPTDGNKQAPGACGCGVADVPATYYADVDGDGFGDPAVSQPGFTCSVPAGFVTNNTDNCPAISGVIGSSCNDGNPNTSGDVINASCQCEGSTIPCPDDGNPCTSEVVVNGVCTHPALPDTDGDGTCDLTDGCPADPNKIAAGACGCGVADVPATYYADVDGDGFGDPAVSQPGFTCSVPAGFVANNTDNCPAVVGVIGSACDDGNANTSGDVINVSCQCEGSSVPCPDDGNPCTSEVVVNGVCTHPALPDTDGDGTCDLTDGCPADPNKIAAGACGCGVADVPATYYADVDGDGFGDPAVSQPGFTCSVPAGFVANNTDNCPSILGVIGSACNDGNANTTGDQINASCQCVGTPVGPGCSFNELSLEIETDGVSTTLWEVRLQGSNTLVANGGQLYAAGLFTESLCLPNGCYYLVVTDDAGDGITGGGYVLRTISGSRIIDDRDNFSTGSVSQIAGGEGFCLPLGTDRLVTSSCDKYDWLPNEYVVVNANPAVTAQYGVTNATSGYQIWVYNPNGGFGFKRFQSHTTTNGLAASAMRACHFRVSSITGIENNVLYNVRVRSRVNGVNAEWGAACRLVVDPLRAQCPLTKLMDIPGNQYFSCNSSRNWGTGNYIAARPVSRITPGAATQSANKYQFRFRLENETFVTTRSSNTYLLNLNWAVNPLQAGTTYKVDVRASFDNGATWCTDFIQPSLDPWGEYCTLTINGGGSFNGGVNLVEEQATSLSMYPNPNRGDQLYLSLENVVEGVNTVSVDIYDTFGKRVNVRTIAVQDGFINTVLEINGELAAGIYVVNITAGDALYTERLVIQP